MRKTSENIIFAGLNTNENRKKEQAWTMKNVYIRTGTLYPRRGSAKFTSAAAFTSAVKSAGYLKTKAGTTRCMAAEGTNLHKANDTLTGWDLLKSDCNNSTFDMVTHFDKLILANGTDILKYDGATLAALGGTPPAFKYLAVWKFRLFGWGVAANPNYLYFCGYDTYGDISNESWPADFAINAGDDNQQIVACIDYLGHLAMFKERAIFLLYGNDENDFDASLKAPGDIGTVARRSVAKLNTIFYLDPDMNVREYSGGAPRIISDAVYKKVLENIAAGKAPEACGIGYNGYYWLAINTDGGSGNNKVLLCDVAHGYDWYLFEYPFRIHQFCLFGDKLYAAGETPNHVFQIDTGTDDYGTAVSWEYGTRIPFMRNMKAKKLYLDVTPVTSGGTLSVYPRVDDDAEGAALPASLSSSETEGINVVEVKLPSTKGHNLSLRLVGTPFPAIHRASVVYIPKPIK